MNVEAFERVSVAVLSAGGEPESRESFDERLNAEPASGGKVIDLEQRQLRDALGVA